MPRLGNQYPPFGVHPHDRHALSENRLDETRVSPCIHGELTRKIRRFHIGKVDHAALGLRYDLLRYDENVTVLEGYSLRGNRVCDHG